MSLTDGGDTITWWCQGQLRRWTESASVSPAERLRRDRLKGMLKDAGVVSRTCWGLTYDSRHCRNYKDTGRFAAFRLTARDSAQCETWHARERRAEAAERRWSERRDIPGH